MESCPEAEKILDDLYGAFESGDASVFERIVAPGADALVIGTDPQEWWQGADDILRAVRAQLGELKEAGVAVERGQKSSFREGSVAWVQDRPSFKLKDGTTAPLRVTAVLVERDGAWQVVQWHGSVGVSNEEVVGTELTV